MEEKMFAELAESVKQMGAIRRGELAPARVTHIESIDVKRIRKKLNLSQSGFANLMGISIRTLQNWEQGSRIPVGPSRRLLELADKEPEALLRAFQQQR